MSDYSWQLEQIMLGIYKLLVHRMTDTWTISFLYLTELDLIDEEERRMDGKKSDPSDQNDPEVENLMMEMGLIDD